MRENRLACGDDEEGRDEGAQVMHELLREDGRAIRAIRPSSEHHVSAGRSREGVGICREESEGGGELRPGHQNDPYSGDPEPFSKWSAIGKLAPAGGPSPARSSVKRAE